MSSVNQDVSTRVDQRWAKCIDCYSTVDALSTLEYASVEF